MMGAAVRECAPARRAALGLVAVLSFLSAAGPVGAQSLDDQWLPWLGCWVPVGATETGAALCFVPIAGGEGVELVRVVGDRPDAPVRLQADGQDREVLLDGCQGTEALRPSNDGLRLYTRSVLTCDGEDRRSASGIMAMVTPTQWLDVRTVDGLQGSTAGQFYQLASDDVNILAGLDGLPPALNDAVRARRMEASDRVTLQQVSDASQNAPAASVEAWLVERGDGFDLTGRALVDLAEAGTPDRVVDVVIALSFPERFSIDRSGQPMTRTAEESQGVGGYGGTPGGATFYPGGYGAFGFGFYGSGGFGYYGFGGYGPGYPGSPFWYKEHAPIRVVVAPTRTRTSRVVNGQGYTRGRSSSSPTTSSSQPRSDGGGGSSGVESGSTGSSGSRTGRKAKRRGGL